MLQRQHSSQTPTHLSVQNLLFLVRWCVSHFEEPSADFPCPSAWRTLVWWAYWRQIWVLKLDFHAHAFRVWVGNLWRPWSWHGSTFTGFQARQLHFWRWNDKSCYKSSSQSHRSLSTVACFCTTPITRATSKEKFYDMNRMRNRTHGLNKMSSWAR